MAIQLPSYPAFEVIDDPSVAQKWENWLDGFEALIWAMKVTDNDDIKAMLVHYAGGEVRKPLKKLPASDQPTNTDSEAVNAYEQAKTILNEHFAPKMNRVFLINSLQQVKQTATESVDAFYMRVKEKYNPLKLEELTPAQIGELVILAQLVNHCTNNSL